MKLFKKKSAEGSAPSGEERKESPSAPPEAKKKRFFFKSKEEREKAKALKEEKKKEKAENKLKRKEAANQKKREKEEEKSAEKKKSVERKEAAEEKKTVEKEEAAEKRRTAGEMPRRKGQTPRRVPFWVKAKQRAAKKKDKKPRNTKRNLESYLNKAGYIDVNVDTMRKHIFQIVLGLTASAWFVVLVTAIINKKTAIDILLFSIGLWTALFAFVWLFVWGFIYFYLEMRIYNRTKQLEEVLPDFLQLTSANISAGMPIDRALWMAIRPSFGVLAKEIEDVAKSTLTGEDLSEALRKFTRRYNSTLLKRSVALILEGLDAGGELADLLNKIALNIQELKIMKKEMSANVMTYAIFISFASIVVAPILFALATQLITIVMNIAGGLDMSGMTSSFMSISPAVGSSMLRDFKIYCITMLAVSSLMAASIIAVIRTGRVKEGITNIPIYILVALIIYFLASKLLGSLLSGIA